MQLKDIISTNKPLSLRVIKLLDRSELIECILKRETMLFEEVSKYQSKRDAVYLKRISKLNIEIKYLNREVDFKADYDKLIKEINDQNKEILRLKRICNDHFVEF